MKHWSFKRYNTLPIFGAIYLKLNYGPNTLSLPKSAPGYIF